MKKKQSARGEFWGKVKVWSEEEFKKRKQKEQAQMNKIAKQYIKKAKKMRKGYKDPDFEPLKALGGEMKG